MSRKKEQEQDLSVEKVGEAINEEREEIEAKVGEESELKTENLTYIGPTIKNAVRRFTTFENGVLPDSVEKKIEEFPAMKLLFVKEEDLAKAAADLTKQSALCSIYEQVKNKFI